ncbi:molybdopterin-dependent oxidoreductase [Sessilibacter sp. MAH4]
MSQLPPRQQITEKFPVVGESSPGFELTHDNWQLQITGLVDSPLTLSWQDYLKFGHQTWHFDIHCVTRWSKLGNSFTGVALKDVLALAGVQSEAKFVQFIAYSDRDHDTSLPLDVCLNDDVLIIHEVNNEPLSAEHGFPVRTFAPSKYFYKSLKWLKEIRLIKEDQLGFWERGGYHNNADFVKEERYVSGNLTEKELSRLRETKNFSRYKDQVLISLDLSNLDFSGADLSGVQLKNCNLDGCNFEGANLIKANLSNSSVLNANLKNANLEGADLDGVLFMGSDLTGANLNYTFLNATEFTREGFDPASVKNIQFDNAVINGLVAKQLEFLVKQG